MVYVEENEIKELVNQVNIKTTIKDIDGSDYIVDLPDLHIQIAISSVYNSVKYGKNQFIHTKPDDLSINTNIQKLKEKYKDISNISLEYEDINGGEFYINYKIGYTNEEIKNYLILSINNEKRKLQERFDNLKVLMKILPEYQNRFVTIIREMKINRVLK